MKYTKEADGHTVKEKWININSIKGMGIIGLTYLGIDRIDVPYLGNKKIESRIRKMYLAFINYDIGKCEKIIRSYPLDRNTLHEDLRVFNYMCFLTDYKRYKLFFIELFRSKRTIHTASFLQICSHRIYQKEGYTETLADFLRKSIEYFESNRIHKWRLSGKFFLGVYSGSKASIFKNFIECLNLNRLEIDMDCWRDKIVYIVSWLRFYYPAESKPFISKVVDYILDQNDKSYNELVLPYLIISEPGILNDKIFTSFNSLEILQRIDSISIKKV